jgi:hypothetical protein
MKVLSREQQTLYVVLRTPSKKSKTSRIDATPRMKWSSGYQQNHKPRVADLDTFRPIHVRS